MPILYDVALSPYAQKVKLALLEKGVPFEVREVDVSAPDAEFLRVSPRAEVPALVDGETAVFDSTIILEYVEDRWPEPPLLPAAPAERARVRMIEDVCDTSYDPVNWGVMEVTVFRRAEGELAARLLARAKEQVAGLNAWLEAQLGDRPWFNGERCGWGDVCVYPFVSSALAQGNGPRAGSRLATWLAAMAERPSAKRVGADVQRMLSGPVMERLAAIAQRREYRDHRVDWMLRSGGRDIVFAGIEQQTIRFSRDVG